MSLARHKFTLVVLALIMASLTIWWGNTRFASWRIENQWAKIRTGMSKSEVTSLLGMPRNVYPAGQVTSNSMIGTLIGNWVFDSFREKWSYGDRRQWDFQRQFPYVGLALDGLMVPEDNDYVIYFSADGTVVKKLHPYRMSKPSG